MGTPVVSVRSVSRGRSATTGATHGRRVTFGRLDCTMSSDAGEEGYNVEAGVLPQRRAAHARTRTRITGHGCRINPEVPSRPQSLRLLRQREAMLCRDDILPGQESPKTNVRRQHSPE